MSERVLPEVTIGVLRIFQRQGQSPLVALSVKIEDIYCRIGIAHGTQVNINDAVILDKESWDRLEWGETHWRM